MRMVLESLHMHTTSETLDPHSKIQPHRQKVAFAQRALGTNELTDQQKEIKQGIRNSPSCYKSIRPTVEELRKGAQLKGSSVIHEKGALLILDMPTSIRRQSVLCDRLQGWVTYLINISQICCSPRPVPLVTLMERSAFNLKTKPCLLQVQTGCHSLCHFCPIAASVNNPLHHHTHTHTPAFRGVRSHQDWPPQRHACSPGRAAGTDLATHDLISGTLMVQFTQTQL